MSFGGQIMPLEDKIEAVKKVESALSKMGGGSAEREGVAAKGPDFRQVLDTLDRGNPSFVVVQSPDPGVDEVRSTIAFQESTETQKKWVCHRPRKEEETDFCRVCRPCPTQTLFCERKPFFFDGRSGKARWSSRSSC